MGVIKKDRSVLNIKRAILLTITFTMTKAEAVKDFVNSNLSGIPQEWFKIVAEEKGVGIYALPMWGTMWICDFPSAERLYKNARVMLSSTDDLLEELNRGDDKYSEEESKKLMTALDTEDWDVSVWPTLYDVIGLHWHEV